jgi:TolB-like protein
MTEEMINQVGNVDPQHLGVIARTSVMHYKNNVPPLDRIGRDLGVQYVLEGSVRRDAQTVRITAQLIRVSDQTHMWSRQYDLQLSNLLAVQAEIATEIAREIRSTLGETPEPTSSARWPARSYAPPSFRHSRMAFACFG